MGLLQQACRTYDCQRGLVGAYREGHPVLAPMAHITTRLDIVIAIDAEGHFQSAKARGKDEPKVVIPATLTSFSRSGTKWYEQPHALSDVLMLLAADDSEKQKFFLEQLQDWSKSDFSHPKVRAVLNYILKKSIIEDLASSGQIELTEDGKPKNEKMMIGWIVNGLGDESGACWTDLSLMKNYYSYYRSKLGNNSDICMVSGKEDVAAESHLKGAVPFFGNAKIISSNDKVNFTYRGRFIEDREAATVGYEASQKAHNALKWLVEDQGIIIGGRVYLCWNPEGKRIPQAINPLLLHNDEEKIEPSDFKERLYGTITGFKKKGELTEKDIAVVVSFDAATTGRLAITYYNEIAVSQFLDRLLRWDERCCIYNNKWGVSIPSLWQIVRCAYGTERGTGRLEVDDRMMKQGISRLLFCRIEGNPFPTDIEKAIVNRASTPTAYDKVWNQVIQTACAVIRKYYFDHQREDYEMALEPKKKDRSYQYGRLLAVLEKTEQDALRLRGEERETSTIRLWSVFSKRPEYASRIIMDQLKSAYYSKLDNGRKLFYEKEIGSIMEELSGFSESELKKALDDTYLLGYYLEKNYLYTPKNAEKEGD